MNDIKATKSEDFAISIIKLTKELAENKHEYIMSKQILRSATSIGANIAESTGSESEADFVHKIMISQKEAIETDYWLRLLYKTDYIDDKTYKTLSSECHDIIRILTAIIRKIKGKVKLNP
jgi:four helix bundle protein